MKRSDISDERVVSACVVSRGFRLRPSLEVLVDMTGAPVKVALRAMERAASRGLIDWGVSIRWAWPTPEGDELAARYLERLKGRTQEDAGEGDR